MARTIRTLAGLGLALALALALPAAADTAALGSTNVSRRVASSAAGIAHVYRAEVGKDGRVNRLSVYLDARNTARAVELGLYTGTSSTPQRRLTRCVITRPRAGGWSHCAIATTPVRKGRSYWLGLLEPRGTSGQ